MTGSPSLVLFDAEMSLFKLFSSDRSGAEKSWVCATFFCCSGGHKMPFRCVALPVLRSQVDTPFSYCLFSFLIAFVYVQGLYVDLVEEKQGVYLYDQDTQDKC